MKYSQQVLVMLEQAVSSQIDNFWEFSFKFNALFGEDENFAEAWNNENPEMFDTFNDFELMMFLEEHDPSDKQGFINFLTPYYEKAKQLLNVYNWKTGQYVDKNVLLTLEDGIYIIGRVLIALMAMI